MPVTMNDYFASPAFDPGILALRSWQAEGHLWYNTPTPDDHPLTGIYLPALPVIGQQVPTPALYATTLDAIVAHDAHRRRSDTQSLWDALGLQSLERSPALSPIWADLAVRGGGTVSSTLWSDFRKSSAFPTTTLHMTAQTERVSKQATRTLSAAIRKGGRIGLKVAGWLLNVPNPTPAGVAVAIIREVGQGVALDLAARGWKSLVAYLRETDQPAPPPPLPGPWPPTGPVTAMFAGSHGTRWVTENAVTRDYEFATLDLGISDADAPPFLAQQGQNRRLPPYVMTLGAGLYR